MSLDDEIELQIENLNGLDWLNTLDYNGHGLDYFNDLHALGFIRDQILTLSNLGVDSNVVTELLAQGLSHDQIVVEFNK